MSFDRQNELEKKEIPDEFQEENSIREARLLISSAISSQFFALYHIWLESRTYVCFQEQLPGILDVIGETGDYEPAWNSYISEYIVPEDQAAMHRFADINTMADRLRDRNSISHEYRRKEIGWTRGQFIAAKRDADGEVTNVIYTVIDINAEKNMEIEQNKVLYEANHDALTDVYNRKAMEEILTSPEIQNIPVGFAIIDVDNFKMANDVFGHEMGDRILLELAKMMRAIFRPSDSVFRIGGDEFGVLLYNCTSSAWEAVCEKLHHIHLTLDRIFKDASVTLSVGIAFSPAGCGDEVIHQADLELYEVKRRGRAGCAMIDIENGQTKYWHDDAVSYKAKNILAFNNTGLYQVEYPLNGEFPPRLSSGEMTREMFGFSQELSPEECYQQWVGRIDPSYLEVLAETRQMVLQGKQTECVYQWNHPQFGKIFVRSGGSGEVVNGVQIIQGYHHFMKDTVIMERKDDRQLLLDSMNAIYFCSYYIDLDHDCFYTMKNAPGEKYLEIQANRATEALHQFLDTLVSPDDLNKMTAFMDFDTLRDRMRNEVHLDCEYLSVTEKGWCRATFFPVKRDAAGRLTHVLFVVTSLDEQKSKEARKGAESRKSIENLYNNVPGGVVMYEWDGRKLKTLHISAYYDKEYGYTLNSGVEDRGPDYSFVHPDDLEEYQKAIANALMVTHELHYDFRRWNRRKNDYAWVHLDAVSNEQADGTSLVYALYTDVSEQKHLELALEKSRDSMTEAMGASNLLSYEYDPITKTGTCFTDENYFGLPKVIKRYPDSFRESDLFHPDDVELFIKTAHQMDKGTRRAKCDVRIKRNGQYGWYLCAFHAFYDHRKEYQVAILTVVDISERKAAMADYENRLTTAMNLEENALVIGKSNLTSNTVDFFKAVDEMKPFVQGVETFDERISRNLDCIVGKEDRRNFRKTFMRSHLLELAELGEERVRMEYLFRIPGRCTYWLETGVNLVRNPLTGEVTAISYSRDIRDTRITSLLLKYTLDQDYLKNIVVLTDTDEFYVIGSGEEEKHESEQHFGNWLRTELEQVMTDPDAFSKGELDRDTVLAYLENHSEYSIAFDCSYQGKDVRCQLRFCYLEKAQNLMLVSVRNITDPAFMEPSSDS